jgi:RNA binding exosome subunit
VVLETTRETEQVIERIAASVNVMISPDGDLDAAVAAVEGYAGAGVDIVVMNLPQDATPALLTDLAERLRPLA